MRAAAARACNASILLVLAALWATAVPGAARADIPSPSVVELGPAGETITGAPMAAGRIASLAADPFVPGRYLALSDTALWVSTDRGNTWSRLPGLERFGEHDFGVSQQGTIAFDPARRGVVLIGTGSDQQVDSQPGVLLTMNLTAVIAG